MEVARALRWDGRMIVSYSNRCFPTKAIAAWLALGMNGRAALMGRYLEAAGFGRVEATVLVDGRGTDPLVVVEGQVS